MSSGFNSETMTTSVEAGSDLSAKQFYLAKVDTSGQLAVASTRGERVHGVLQDDPSASGRSGSLAYGGISQVECGGTFEEGDPITTDSNSKAIKADRAGDVVIGTALEAGVSGARASIIVGVAGGSVGTPQMIHVEDFENSYDAVDDPAAIQADGTVASGTAADVNILHLKSGNLLYSALGTQTITVPVVVTDAVNSLTGLNISMDQTSDDGVNIWSHFGPSATGRPFVIGSDAAFYMSLKFSIADVSGTDDFHVGFRRAEIPNAAFDNYLDAAGFHVDGTTLNLETILNNGATTTTDTTDAMADAARTYTFKILVSAAGVVTYQHDITAEGTLAAPSTTAAFTFDDGDPVIPFVFFLHTADLAGELPIYKWEVGYQ